MSKPKQLSDGRREAIWSAAAPEVTSLRHYRLSELSYLTEWLLLGSSSVETHIFQQTANSKGYFPKTNVPFALKSHEKIEVNLL
jgi:hypothetical protein